MKRPTAPKGQTRISAPSAGPFTATHDNPNSTTPRENTNTTGVYAATPNNPNGRKTGRPGAYVRENDARVAALSRAWSTTEDVSEACGLSKRRARKSLEAMYHRGLLERGTRGDGAQLWRLTADAAGRLLPRGGAR